MNVSAPNKSDWLTRTLKDFGFRGRVEARRLQVVLVVGMAIGITGILALLVSSARQPAVAIGIVLQTVAGLLAATRVWANRATDAVIRWAAREIEINRFGLTGFLDGSLRSFVIATAWCCLGAFVGGAASWPAAGVLDWVVLVLAVILLWSGTITWMLAMSMFAARALLVGLDSPRDGAVLRGLRDWLIARDWVWAIVGLLILVGSLLQLSAA